MKWSRTSRPLPCKLAALPWHTIWAWASSSWWGWACVCRATRACGDPAWGAWVWAWPPPWQRQQQQQQQQQQLQKHVDAHACHFVDKDRHHWIHASAWFRELSSRRVSIC
ncbi:hypothetical protein DUNSADRAFT_6714 [Dunaliella salina]|uniref:Secreted protein n=1 Tax=Dunaliella salina TaxID=3046 RepID=A0ABQ7GMR3_DUNSA|nr:hypothetical protein DUNSADRAFT_6714 [Dunaliella salina]|eukprot:KAF5835901.1 hypothetical protein DUNSADRAFT_6714 [Dunaliella salina]